MTRQIRRNGISFSLIKKRIEQAALTLLTANQEEAQRILEVYKVSAEIKYNTFERAG